MICSPVPLAAVPQTQRLFYSAGSEHLLLGTFGSFAFDFIARQKVGGTHFTFEYLRQMPVPTREALEPFDGQIRQYMLELGYTAWDMTAFGEDLGYNGPPFRWDDERRALIRAEIDALMFLLYGMDRRDIPYILETFERVSKNDIKRWGEYRTKRLILERYEAMTQASLTGRPYETVLDPSPAHPSVAHKESTRPEWTTL